MIVGVPKEMMRHEGRVAITPEGVKALVGIGHKVVVQNQAGKKSGYSDKEYCEAGALIDAKPQSIYQADLVVKVKEPQEKEYELLKESGIIFAFLHLPANPRLVKVLQKKKNTAIAYEGIELKDGQTPILQPMSVIAGEVAVQKGLRYLSKDPQDATVVILGAAGTVGQAATKTALKVFGTSVIALDLPGKLHKIYSDKYQTRISTPENIEEAIKKADLLIGAVASRGKKAPKLVSKEVVSSMEPGSVIVDVAIDEGGCIETSKPTTHDNPVFVEQGVIHYCVKNIPGAYPELSTPALTTATLPYILEITNKGLEKAIKENPALAKGIHVYQGKLRI